MEEVSLKLGKINFRGVVTDNDMIDKDKEATSPLMAMLARSTPNSPNSFRLNFNQGIGVVDQNHGTFFLRSIASKLEKCISEPDFCNAKSSTEIKDTLELEASCPGSKSDGHIAGIAVGENHIIDEEEGECKEEKEGDKGSEDDITRESKMLSESRTTPQPPVITLRHNPPPQCPAEALIMPRKPVNPCLESQDRQNLHRELLFNQKIGRNVLNQKSELQRAQEKHKETQIKKELEMQKQECRTPFERVIEERAKRLETLEKHTDEEENGNTPEFLQVYAKLRARMETK